MSKKSEAIHDVVAERDHVDPITGEILAHELPVRPRRRDSYLDDLGREIPDPRPMQPPIGYKKQPSLFEMVRTATAAALLARAREQPESFEESDDFDIPDDPLDPSSPWENDFDPPLSEVRQAILADRKARKAAEEAAEQPRPSAPKPTVPGDPDPIA